MRAPDRSDGGIDVQAMADLIQRLRPRLVCVTHVPTNSGLVQDVRSIGSPCHDAGVLYLVDACQSVGQMPIDVAVWRCDFLSAIARRFLRGPRGAGFLYLSDRALELGLAPLYVDMRGADWIAADAFRLRPDARRFENYAARSAAQLMRPTVAGPRAAPSARRSRPARRRARCAA